MGAQRSRQAAAVALPKGLVVAKRRVVPGPTGRSAGCPQKQSSPYIHRVQYTVLSVAGLKGELSQAELHFLKARMRGGVLNKARRGELEMGPPVGLVYLPDGSLGLDPDQEVRAAICLVFDTFERTGSAMQTIRFFHQEGLRFPRRIRGGANKGELLWSKPDHSRILQILHNPRYAGAFVYGRTRAARKPDGKYTAVRVPREKWQYLIRDIHPGYISWDRFEANQKRLAENTLAFGPERTFGPAREGPALLQGRVLCGISGERMGVHYWADNGRIVSTYVCQEASVHRGAKVCQRVPGIVVDRAISDLLLGRVALAGHERAWRQHYRVNLFRGGSARRITKMRRHHDARAKAEGVPRQPAG